MNKNSRIYVAGHRGLVGSAITKSLKAKGYDNLLQKTRDELNLEIQSGVSRFFEEEKPEYVFLAAARVGGIMANDKYRADFIWDNLIIQANVISSCWKSGVKKLLFMGSTCIYPKNAPVPIRETSLLTSPLEHTNEPYAIAKIAGLKLCESFNIQYGTDFIPVMPTNLYGQSDNYDLENSHVLPGLLRKIHLSHLLEEGNWEGIRADFDRNPVCGTDGKAGREEMTRALSGNGILLSDGASPKVTLTLWGTGKPLREFMYSQDMADACVFIMENVSVKDIREIHRRTDPSDPYPPHFLNIGTGDEISVRDLAFRIRDIVGFRGNIEFDKSKPDGTFRKTTDTSALRSLGFVPSTDLETGIRTVYKDYLGQFQEAR